MVDEHDHEAVTAARPESFWAVLRRWLLPGGAKASGKLAQRLLELERAIHQHPDAATNYILRGELYLKTGDYEAAYADFEQALDLAAVQVETADWGVVAQAMQDRALVGLRAAAKHVDRTPMGASRYL